MRAREISSLGHNALFITLFNFRRFLLSFVDENAGPMLASVSLMSHCLRGTIVLEKLPLVFSGIMNQIKECH